MCWEYRPERVPWKVDVREISADNSQPKVQSLDMNTVLFISQVIVLPPS